MPKTKTITREYDDNGRCIKEVIVEEDGEVTLPPLNPYPYKPYTPYWAQPLGGTVTCFNG